MGSPTFLITQILPELTCLRKYLGIDLDTKVTIQMC